MDRKNSHFDRARERKKEKTKKREIEKEKKQIEKENKLEKVNGSEKSGKFGKDIQKMAEKNRGKNHFML